MLFKAMKYSAVIFIVLLSTTRTSFATSFSFSDTITNPSTSGWKHTLDSADFTPTLDAGDSISNITDAMLDIQMDIDLAGHGNVKLFEVAATGDTYFLDSLNISSSHGTINDKLWSIDLDTLSNATDVLQAISDGGSFQVTLSAIKGSIKGIDFATLSGHADVTAQPDPPAPPDPFTPPDPPAQPDVTPVPEPSTFFLLGAGLLGVGLVRKGLRNNEEVYTQKGDVS